MNKLEELKKKYAELGAEIEKLGKNESKAWEPKENEEYHTIAGNGVTHVHIWEKDICDKSFYELGNCFKTEAEAESVAEKIKIYTQLKRLAEELNTEPIDWENMSQWKNYICKDGELLFYQSTQSVQYIGQIYCTNKDFLKIAKERIGEENLLKLFK